MNKERENIFIRSVKRSLTRTCSSATCFSFFIAIVLLLSSTSNAFSQKQPVQTGSVKKAFLKTQELTIAVENYFSANFYANNYWDSFKNKWTGDNLSYEKAEGELLKHFRPTQRKLFTDVYQAGFADPILFSIHERKSKLLLDSLWNHYMDDYKNAKEQKFLYNGAANEDPNTPEPPTPVQLILDGA